MNFRKLGRTHLKVSEIGFGGWAIGGGWGPQSDADSAAALNRALDLGVNFIDTAAGYGDGRSERIIAGVLKGRRESVVVATKTPPTPGPWPPSPYCVACERYPERYLRENIEQRLQSGDGPDRHPPAPHVDPGLEPESRAVCRPAQAEGGGEGAVRGRVHARARPEQRDRAHARRLGRRRPGDLQHL